MTIYVQLAPGAKVPVQATQAAAGYDLALAGTENVFLAPGSRVLCPTGITMALPPGTVAIIKPRSGLALRHGIDVMAGVIDSDYRGEIGVLLINHGVDVVRFAPGDRIAQMVVVEHYSFPLRVVESLDATERNDHGFGSTGVR